MEYVIETNNLTKIYNNKIKAVENLNLRVRAGEIYGFLGPNGAGKTTTLKMLLGLIKPTSGSARILGKVPGTPDSLSLLGSLVESPAFYPYLSGRDNLRVIADYSGAPRSRIDEVLDIVGLKDRANDKFKGYSLGMKQRLGVAATLLKDPQILILDEPTNGLDPKGMAEMRELIRNLGQGNRTVLLSSHLLNEVEQICDRVGVIQQGRLIAEGTISELKGSGALLVRATPSDLALSMLRSLDYVEKIEERDGALLISTDPSMAAEINRLLVQSGVAVSELHPTSQSLEEVFLNLTEVNEEQVV
ncbi:ABC transporter related protein [Thermobaculum terrenum ATCC BAA-798]|uniref:ABC transporter related protein n=1 Tax=Thermobaculum terrenum (strain ATCC BAA-798 / CCMEE 7001 / YNP1) TaxID=525904 RepID=D1CCR0_THET1|nr:ABC transporter ATP-binding protein [Thermobaculum terrenum]ACZ42575.1 ABC transporter related protein [Thermobaculum terrenum ATCC BAA-798]